MNPNLFCWTLLILMDVVLCRTIDLSHVIDRNSFAPFGAPKYNWSELFLGINLGVYMESGAYSIGEHVGTHIDAPSHFSKGSKTLEKLTIEDTIAEGVMIDCSEEARQDREYQVTLEKIEEWEIKHGKIPDQAAVIFNFGWSAKFGNPLDYVGDAKGNISNFVFPSISETVSDFLLYKRNIKIIGTDTVSPDAMKLRGKPLPRPHIHTTYLPRDRLIVENLKGTDQLPAKNFRFFANPTKFDRGTGGQVRAFAMTFDPKLEEENGAAKHSSMTASIVCLMSFLAAIVY
ncbi:isatin hydrolase-like [Physella acuta]|uniref:isatin hydrolase-like n=1 Tax=Physella acuta TaxID=109671 RepID=UPI0027DDFB4F|nr:isatin hydrolase-like [Physella acuta]